MNIKFARTCHSTTFHKLRNRRWFVAAIRINYWQVDSPVYIQALFRLDYYGAILYPSMNEEWRTFRHITAYQPVITFGK